MRKTKFRAWDSMNNKFAFEGFHLIGEVMLFDLLTQYRLEEQCDLIINQCTALNFNGIDLYVNDIFDIGQTVNGQSKFVIVDCIGGYDVRYAHDLSRKYEYDVNDLLSIEEIKIVGNIYQNP